MGIGRSACGQGGHRGPSRGGTGDKTGEAGPEAHFPCSYEAHMELLDALPALAWAHEAEIVPRSARTGQLYPGALMPSSVHLERGPCPYHPLPRAPAQTGSGHVKPVGAPWYGVVRHRQGVQDPSVGHSGGRVLQSWPQRINVIQEMPGRLEIRRVMRIKVEVSWSDSQVSQIQAFPFCVLPPHAAPQGRMARR